MIRRSMPIAEWPEQDRVLLQALHQKGGPFDDVGAWANLRASSIKLYTNGYSRWLHWLFANAADVLQEPPASRATMPLMRAWLTSLTAVGPTSQHIFFNGALQFLRASAPDIDWSELLRIKRRLERAAGRGDPARKQGRILSSQVLLNAAIELAGPISEAAPTPLARAKLQRDGTMMALLTVMPMRHRAFAALEIGKSLLVSEATATVSLPAELTKNGHPWEADVPESAYRLLRHYIQETRPFLLSRSSKSHDLLWVCSNGDPMSYSYVGQRIPNITEAMTGVRIPLHFFRDSASTTLSRMSPTSAKLIRPVMGHASSKTAERHYIHAGTIEAAHDYNKLISNMRTR